MQLMDIDQDRAVGALGRLQRHVPVDIDMARIVAVHPADTEHELGVAFVAVDGTVWWSHHGRGVRYVDAGHGLCELTEWAWRVETSRQVVPVE